jgi:hypothetical protein
MYVYLYTHTQAGKKMKYEIYMYRVYSRTSLDWGERGERPGL